MNLQPVLKEIVTKLERGGFSSEASVSQGVVLPILNALGWPVFDTSIVTPEYSMENRRVDFALCHPPSKPVIFIEVKKVGLTEGADRQLFEYAFHRGVPLAVLTDGQTWSFYLPGEAGRYDERRVYKVDLLGRTVNVSEERLERYLGYKRTTSGDGLRAAQADYRNVARERDIQRSLPIAWSTLIEEQDSILLDLLAEKVEDICGYKPTMDSCSDFMNLLSRTGGLAHRSSSFEESPKPFGTPETHRPVLTGREPGQRAVGKFTFSFFGKEYSATTAIEVVKTVLELLESKDPGFLERFASRKHGRKRQFLARNRAELYPGRPDLEGRSLQVCGSWWLGTNYSRPSMQKIINLAKEVVDPRVAEQLKVNIVGE